MTLRRTVVLLAALATALLSVPHPAQAAGASWWKPKASAALRWQIQLSGKLNTAVPAHVFDVDGDETTKAQVAALHRKGAKVICYVSAGSYENYRADRDKFPAEVLGKTLDGWPDERWLDVRRWDVLGPIMEARFKACRAKGFDAVDPDNMDGYANDNGLGLTGSDQLAYNKRIANLAHSLGLAVGLKNDLAQIPKLVPYYDFAVNEQCAYYRECDLLKPFVAAGKPVFEIEYEVPAADFCAASRRLGFTAVFKRLSLSEYRKHC